MESLGTGVNWADWCWAGSEFGGTESEALDWSPWFWGHGRGRVLQWGQWGHSTADSPLCPPPDVWHPGFFLEESQDPPVVPPPASCTLTVKDLLLSGSSDNVSPCPCVPNSPCPFLDPAHPSFPSLSLPSPTLVPFPFLLLVHDPCPFLAQATFTVVPGRVSGASWGGCPPPRGVTIPCSHSSHRLLAPCSGRARATSRSWC